MKNDFYQSTSSALKLKGPSHGIPDKIPAPLFSIEHAERQRKNTRASLVGFALASMQGGVDKKIFLGRRKVPF